MHGMNNRMLYGIQPPIDCAKAAKEALGIARQQTPTMAPVCPVCGGAMWRHRVGATVTRWVLTCVKCKYTCSADFVSGYWAGVKATKKKVSELLKPEGEPN